MGVMRFAGGVTASFHDAYTIGNAPTGVEIYGTEGSLIGTEVLRQGPIGDVVLRRGGQESAVDVGIRENLYAGTVVHFTEAVRGTGKPDATGEDGLRSLAVALAVAESARTGQRVKVRLAS